jgi:hypothetical protein
MQHVRFVLFVNTAIAKINGVSKLHSPCGCSVPLVCTFYESYFDVGLPLREPSSVHASYWSKA